MNYLVTGATGFIGRYVVDLLLKRPENRVHALVRPGSETKLEQLRQRLDVSPDRLVLISGDLGQPSLGISDDNIRKLNGEIDHFFHIGAIYDLNAAEEPQRQVNVDGTRQALSIAARLGVGCFHHVSSIAVAGTYDGHFREDMFEQATGLDDPYFVTKHLAEKCVREEAEVPYRIYRPSMVVGDSRTGTMDKVDGPYYLFRLLEALGRVLPDGFPLVGIEGGQFNIVPVDYVAKAMVYIAHQPGWDGQCFHLTDSRHYRLQELLDLISQQSDQLPRFIWDVPNALLDLLPEKSLPTLARQPWMQSLLNRLQIAPGALGYVTYRTTYDRTQAEKALQGSSIELPQFEDYLPVLWRYWQEHLSPKPVQSEELAHQVKAEKGDRVRFRRPAIMPLVKRARDHWVWNAKRRFMPDKALQQRVRGKLVVLTGASSGIGSEVAHQLAFAGATVLLVARSEAALQEIAADIRARGGQSYAYPADLSDGDDCDRVCHEILADFGTVDILINNAGRSIRRSLKFSVDRFHDYERTMQINYFGSVRMALNFLPAMLEQKDGHIINVSTVGVQAAPARFTAYLGSKWALEGWSWAAANELAHTGVTVSTINYPLVRTPMIAPTKIYDYTPAMSPEQAVQWLLDVIVTRNKRKVGPLGLAALAMYYALPKTSESIVNTFYQLVYEAPPENYRKINSNERRLAAIPETKATEVQRSA